MLVQGLSIAALTIVLGGAGLTLHQFLKDTEEASKTYELAMEKCRLIPHSIIDPTDRVEEMRCYKAAEADYAREIQKATPEKVLDALERVRQQLQTIVENFEVDNQESGIELFKQ